MGCSSHRSLSFLITRPVTWGKRTCVAGPAVGPRALGASHPTGLCLRPHIVWDAAGPSTGVSLGSSTNVDPAAGQESSSSLSPLPLPRPSHPISTHTQTHPSPLQPRQAVSFLGCGGLLRSDATPLPSRGSKPTRELPSTFPIHRYSTLITRTGQY